MATIGDIKSLQAGLANSPYAQAGLFYSGSKRVTGWYSKLANPSPIPTATVQAFGGEHSGDSKSGRNTGNWAGVFHLAGSWKFDELYPPTFPPLLTTLLRLLHNLQHTLLTKLHNLLNRNHHNPNSTLTQAAVCPLSLWFGCSLVRLTLGALHFHPSGSNLVQDKLR